MGKISVNDKILITNVKKRRSN